MGQQASAIIGAVGSLDCCSTWAKYVCNSGHLHSKCGCCELDAETEKIELSSDSELELEVADCCSARKA